MAGYSSRPLPGKLGIKQDHRVVLLNAPKALDGLEPLPAGVRVASRLPKSGEVDVLLFFTKSRAELEERLPGLKARLAQDGGLWVCWPKKASKIPTDVTEDVAREIALAAGLVDNKVCAVDDIWSALRLVIRLRDRK